jgi:thymidylate synthase ThyX
VPAARRIYLLSPRAHDPETIAVAFAKTSRSPQGFDEIAAELSAAASAEFHEKWVVGYGHASVAEHAVLHIALENVSRLAIECIESNRLASYTEKSTRYQTWAQDGYHVPAEFSSGTAGKLYTAACDALFAAYEQVLPPLRLAIAQQHPRRTEESSGRYEARIRSMYVDVARYLLPASALANVGMTANARVFEGAIRKMLSHPLAEVQAIGEEVKAVALRETPTLVKYAAPSQFMIETRTDLEQRARALAGAARDADWLTLTDYEQNAEAKVLAASLYAFGEMPFARALEVIAQASPAQRAEIAAAALGRLDRFDNPLRELEYATYAFDCTIDQGAYFEIKRHRLMTQTPQVLTAELGFATPRLLADANVLQIYNTAMTHAASCYSKLVKDAPHAAAYVVPNGFNRRFMMVLNLRQAFHLCELRSAPNAHFAVRRMAGRMHEMISAVHPLLAGFMRWSDRPAWQSLETDYFMSTT